MKTINAIIMDEGLQEMSDRIAEARAVLDYCPTKKRAINEVRLSKAFWQEVNRRYPEYTGIRMTADSFNGRIFVQNKTLDGQTVRCIKREEER